MNTQTIIFSSIITAMCIGFVWYIRHRTDVKTVLASLKEQRRQGVILGLAAYLNHSIEDNPSPTLSRAVTDRINKLPILQDIGHFELNVIGGVKISWFFVPKIDPVKRK